MITTRKSAEVLKLREVRDGKNKDLFFCEGHKLIGELLTSTIKTTQLYATEPALRAAKKFIDEKNKKHVPISVLSEDVMEFVSDMTTPPGLIAVAKRPAVSGELQIEKEALVLFLIGLQLPQNMGALLRTAEAAGVTRVLVSNGSCDPYNPKAVRGSTGSVFRLNIHTGLDAVKTLKHLKSEDVQCVAAHQNGSVAYAELDWKKSTALLVGAEGPGFEDQLLQEVDATVKIPMRGQVESLNVGVAAAVCLFEAARQRLAPSTT